MKRFGAAHSGSVLPNFLPHRTSRIETRYASEELYSCNTHCSVSIRLGLHYLVFPSFAEEETALNAHSLKRMLEPQLDQICHRLLPKRVVRERERYRAVVKREQRGRRRRVLRPCRKVLTVRIEVVHEVHEGKLRCISVSIVVQGALISKESDSVLLFR